MKQVKLCGTMLDSDRTVDWCKSYNGPITIENAIELHKTLYPECDIASSEEVESDIL